MVDYNAALNKDGISLFDFTQPTCEYHSHYFFELVYVKSGKIIHYLDGEKYIIKQGDYFIIDIHTKHRYEQINNEDAKICNCIFLPEMIDKTLKNCKKFSYLIENYLIRFNESILKYNPTSYIFCDNDGSILSLIEKLKSESLQKTYGYSEILRCTLIEMLIATMRKIINNDKLLNMENITKHIIKYIEKNYDKKVTLSHISSELNYSLPYISSKFKSDTGYTFTEYLQKYRIEQSSILLANTDKTIFDISSAVGYDDIKFFGKLFKKYMYVTPTEFRKSNMNK